MSDEVKPPDACRTMGDVRAGVDATDAALVALLAHRFGYMRAAARIKDKRSDVRDEARKAEVIAAVRTGAKQAGLPADVFARLWDDLVESSIAYEMEEWERLRR